MVQGLWTWSCCDLVLVGFLGREARPDPQPNPRKTAHHPFRIMYIMLNVGRYYAGLIRLLLASLLPLRGSKDKASIDACAST